MKAQRRWQIAWLAQAALIVLPVIVLSGVAFHFLREDQTAIEQEAKNRAASLAPETARRISEQVSAFVADGLKKGLVTQGEIVDGRGFAVPDYPRLPIPADWPSSRANAQLGLLITAESHSDPAVLIRQAVTVAHQNPGEVTESGTPIADLALLVALRHTSKGDLPPDLAAEIESNITLHPSFLSTTLLDSVGGTTGTRLRAEWLKQEAAREVTRNWMRALYPRLKSIPIPIVRRHPNGAGGLALCIPSSHGWRITLLEAEPLRRTLHPDLPDYLGASLNIDGERWEVGEPRRTKFVRLATASGRFPLDSRYPFRVALDLRNPDLLYAPYRRRLLLTQLLILSGVVAALLGLWRLWQTYCDQTRLNELKSNLVSSVSHELRAPIAAVRLMAESLESGRVAGAEKQKDYYRMIVRECGRLSSLVENVLDYSRIDQGRKQYRFEPVDAMALLRHTVMLMEPGAAERQVQLRLIDPPPEFENLQPSWDREAVEQSMVNLLDNAIKYSPADAEVRVEVELMPSVVRLWVCDTGPGVPAEERKKIFDLFYRCGSELRRETEGVGIGLSIVKHVAEAHGGRVLVESNAGRGSRFGLELPR